MIDTLFILAAGMSSRMKKSFEESGLSEEEKKQVTTQSKSLISFGRDDRPFLDYLLMNAEKAGFKNIVLVIGETADQFKASYPDSKFNNLSLVFAVQYVPKNRIKPFGTADALAQALEQHPSLKTQSFAVCNSDNLYSTEALRSIREEVELNAFIAYSRNGLKFSSQRINRFALVLLDADNYLTDIIEKPSIENTKHYYDESGNLRVSMNIWKLNGPSIYTFLINCPVNPERNEKELPTAILNLCREKSHSVLGIPMNEHVPDLTSKDDIEILKQYIDNNY